MSTWIFVVPILMADSTPHHLRRCNMSPEFFMPSDAAYGLMAIPAPRPENENPQRVISNVISDTAPKVAIIIN